MTIDFNDPKMAGYKHLEEFRYGDMDHSTRVRDYPEEKRFIEFLQKKFSADSSSITAERPTVTTVGYRHFDITLGFPIWWNGSNWVNASGTSV